ncbi:MAG: T9SS type A sorting domain-containing protein [Bacteroidetes bacterium]|nr:T9SS type A sorting domain-containing protein [Bacteroidota bacterium]
MPKVVYTYSGSTLGLGSLVWDWGDGHSSTVVSGFSTPIYHTYPSTGKQYQVCVNVYGFCGSGQYCDLSAPVSVNSALCTASGAFLYPNPAQDLVYLSNAEGAEMSIQNYLGQTLHRFTITSKKEQVKIYDLAAGLYLMQIKHTDGQREVLRWTKE